jgi:hypothetical protein
MNARQKKAMLALHKQGMSIIEIANHFDIYRGLVEVVLNKELAIESALEKPKLELKQKPEQTVLKWIKFNKDDETTYPKNRQHCLVVNRDNYYFICFFSKTSSNSMNFYLLNPKAGTEGEVIDNIVYWIPLPSAPRNEDEINDEYLIEQTAIETFDIIDAITPALRDAVKHLLVQQGASK